MDLQQGRQWRLTEYHPMFPRKDALRYRDGPFYMVIAGSFPTEAAAERYVRQYWRVLSEDQCPALVERSGDFARLRPGWFIVIPCGGETFTLKEAHAVRRKLAQAGVRAYVRRVH
jgi:hypothetical protein